MTESSWLHWHDTFESVGVENEIGLRWVGLDGTRWDGMRRNEMAWDGIGLDETGSVGIRWDRMGWDGMARFGID